MGGILVLVPDDMGSDPEGLGIFCSLLGSGVLYLRAISAGLVIFCYPLKFSQPNFHTFHQILIKKVLKIFIEIYTKKREGAQFFHPPQVLGTTIRNQKLERKENHKKYLLLS